MSVFLIQTLGALQGLIVLFLSVALGVIEFGRALLQFPGHTMLGGMR